jgi:hypothetical protein
MIKEIQILGSHPAIHDLSLLNGNFMFRIASSTKKKASIHTKDSADQLPLRPRTRYHPSWMCSCPALIAFEVALAGGPYGSLQGGSRGKCPVRPDTATRARPESSTDRELKSRAATNRKSNISGTRRTAGGRNWQQQLGGEGGAVTEALVPS